MRYNLEQMRKEFRAGKRAKFIFFWGHQKSNSGEITQTSLSQWWSAELVINGIKYFSAEHYMMAEKARLFKDEINLKKIIESKSPAQAKQFGRKVVGFSDSIWNKNRFEIVIKGNLAKFSQNQDLKRYLLSTKNKILVEASPVDPIWGIGLDKENAHSKNPLKWKGLNLLGFALMEVRDILSTKDQ